MKIHNKGEFGKMTDKELMYLDDALAHAKFLKSQCDECAARLSDPSLKSFVTDLSAKHQAIFGGFYNLL